jgi:ATP/ADP translocase
MAWTQSRRRTPAATERMESRVILAGPAAAPDEAAILGDAERGSRSGAGRLARFARRVLAVGREPYVGRLILVGMMGALTGVLVEFLFYLIAASAPRTMGANARFFASAYLVMNASALLLQLVAFRPMQRRIGITGMLMALPLVLFGGAAALLAGLAMAIGSGLRIAEGGVKQSLHRSSWEQAFLPVRRADRGLAKLIVDGAGARIAEGLAAALLVLWIRFGLKGRAPVAADARGLVAALVVATLTWLLLANALRRRTIRHAAANPEDRCRPDSPLPDG